METKRILKENIELTLLYLSTTQRGGQHTMDFVAGQFQLHTEQGGHVQKRWVREPSADLHLSHTEEMVGKTIQQFSF